MTGDLENKQTVQLSTQENKYTSRKFIIVLVLFAISLIIAIVMPDFVGTGQVLFNFWIFLFTAYAGGNIGEHYVKGKK